jgi:hypothetical protein
MGDEESTGQAVSRQGWSSRVDPSSSFFRVRTRDLNQQSSFTGNCPDNQWNTGKIRE